MWVITREQSSSHCHITIEQSDRKHSAENVLLCVYHYNQLIYIRYFSSEKEAVGAYREILKGDFV